MFNWLNSLTTLKFARHESSRKRLRQRSLRRLTLEQLETRLTPSALITTDKPDYHPGEVGVFTGSGFAANEKVDLAVVNDSNGGSPAGQPSRWTVAADASGGFTTLWACTGDLVGASLEVDATGETASDFASAAFTDGGTQGQGAQIFGYDTTVGTGTLYDTNHRFASKTIVGVDVLGLTGNTTYFLKVSAPGNAGGTPYGGGGNTSTPGVFTFTTGPSQTTFNESLDAMTGFASDPNATGPEFKVFIDTVQDFSSTKGSGFNFKVGTTTKADPTLTTSAGDDFTLGTTAPTLADTADLESGTSPTGTITFTLAGPNGQIYSNAVTVSSNGIYHSTDAGTSTGSATLATSGTVVGTYTWSAVYSGDGSNNEAFDQGGPAEQTVVGAASPSIVTTASPGITLDATGAPTISDSVVMSGAYFPTGTVNVTLKLGSTTVKTDSFAAANGTVTESYTLPSDGSTVAGTYTWSVSYAGDGNNNGTDDTKSASNETTVVSPASPTLVTTANPNGTIYAGLTAPTLSDSAVLAGGYYETGSITFILHFGTSTGAAVYCHTVTVSGNGAYSSGSTNVETAVGTYVWTACYTGDGNNNIAKDDGSSAAEQVTIRDQVVNGEGATMGFWANNNGQALLKTYGAALGNYLASYGNLFGNLAGATGTQVAAYFLKVKSAASGVTWNTYAQALTTALNVWTTTTGLGWNTTATGPTHYGFHQGFGGLGLGDIYYNVGSNGISFGVANNSLMKVGDLLTYLNSKTTRTGGSVTALPTKVYFYSATDTVLSGGANNVFNGINNMGDIV